MLIDAAPVVRIPTLEALSAYARRVAGAVGVLSCRIFGVPGDAADDFAIFLGETLQLTNILRDVDEDAAIDRLYLPTELLVQSLIPTDGPATAIVADLRFREVCDKVAVEVADRYQTLPGMIPASYRRQLRPALIMQLGYEAIFKKLKLRGWRNRGPRPRLTKRERLVTILDAFGR
jgi:phytoene synthase